MNWSTVHRGLNEFVEQVSCIATPVKPFVYIAVVAGTNGNTHTALNILITDHLGWGRTYLKWKPIHVNNYVNPNLSDLWKWVWIQILESTFCVWYTDVLYLNSSIWMPFEFWAHIKTMIWIEDKYYPVIKLRSVYRTIQWLDDFQPFKYWTSLLFGSPL